MFCCADVLDQTSQAALLAVQQGSELENAIAWLDLPEVL